MDRIGLNDRGRQAIDALRNTKSREDLEAAGVTPEVQEALLNAGLVEAIDDTRPPVLHMEAFSGWKSQRGMLVDHVRTEAYQSAINAVVMPGDRVVDVGTGSGVLAMFAARAGASEAHGLEITDMADWAARLAVLNGCDAVKITKGDAGQFTLDGQADVLIGEYFGMTFFDEWHHYRAFVTQRDRLLRAGGSVIPRAGRFLFSAVDSQKLYLERGYGFYEAPAYGLDFSAVREAEMQNPRRYIVTADYNTLVTTQTIAEFDFLTSGREAFAFTNETEFTYPADGTFHGFVAHFELDMAPGQILATGPGARETCWHHSYFPMPKRLMQAGDTLVLRTRSFLDPERDLACLGLSIAGPNEQLDAAVEHVFALD